jgi:uncharacterized lipoprotein YajG
MILGRRHGERYRGPGFGLCAIAIIGLALGACEAGIKLDYAPATGVAPVAGAEAVPVSVTGVDMRTQDRDRVSTKNGALRSPVRAENDVVELVRKAVETELKAEGFPSRAGGVAIVAELEEFQNKYILLVFNNTALAKVTFTLKVKGANGITRYSRSYSGLGREPYVMSETGNTAKVALERALAAAMQEVVADRALSQAILAAGAATGR